MSNTLSPAERSITPILKEIPPVLPTKLKYQFDKLNIHIKHNTDSPASAHSDINEVHIKSTTDSPGSPNSDRYLTSQVQVWKDKVYPLEVLMLPKEIGWYLSKNI